MKKLLRLGAILNLLFISTLAHAATSSPFVIPIETSQKGLYVLVEADAQVRVCYFGDKIEGYDNIKDIYPVGENPEVSNTKRSLYPTFGNGYVDEVALKLTHADGNMTTRLVYDSHKVAKVDDNVTLTNITLKDQHYPLYVSIDYTTYSNENIFTQTTTIKNSEKGDIKIEGAASAYLPVVAEKYYLTRYYGSWAGEMNMTETELGDGITVIDSKRGVRTTQDGMPSFILSLNGEASEQHGEVIMGSLAWSGNYKLSFEIDNLKEMNIFAGANDFLSDYTIGRKEEFETPKFVFTHSNSGTGQASRNLHDWVRGYNIRQGDVERPVVLNSWEGAYFKFDEQVITKMIDDAASMGVEIFVLDDGWFATKYPRNNDKQGLGDWHINYDKLPNGIQGLIDHAKLRNIKFGIWVEPEMVNPKSELAEKHPDWIVTSPNRTTHLMRNQQLLDLTNPKVQEFAYNVVADLLTDYPDIAYIKWDANRHVGDFGSSYLAKDEQSHFWIDYIHGLYSIYERLEQNFPDVIFQACASGAGRVDYGSIKYHHEVWGSDNTDAESRIFINWGINQFFPSQAVASHVSQSPNHQTGHSSPIKFRFDVAMAQRLGVELQPKLLSKNDLEWTKQAIAEYKRIRPVVQLGDQYRLISPYSDTGYASMIYVDKAQDRAVLFAYSIGFHYRELYPTVKLQGLDRNKMYKVTEVMPNKNNNSGKYLYAYDSEGAVLSGDFLMKYGMKLNIIKRNQSAVFEIVAIE